MLAIETATELVGAALADGAARRAESSVTGRRRHAEALAPAIDHVLTQAGVTLASVTDLAVDVGPGLFTGLRVGLATAQGLAEGLGLPVWPCTSLEVLGRSALHDGAARLVAAVVDARRGEVFAALYAPAPPGSPEGTMPSEEAPPALYSPGQLAAALARWSGGSPLLVVGDGSRRYADELGAVPGVQLGGSASPTPGGLLALAADRRACGVRPIAAAQLSPLYLREPDARSNWSQRSPEVPPPVSS